jgi:hypothetical protein
MISVVPPVSPPNGVFSGVDVVLDAARDRLDDEARLDDARLVDAGLGDAALGVAAARRVAVRRVVVVAARRVEDARLATRRRVVVAVALVRLAARRVVVAARRRVVVARAPAPDAICRACFVRLSMRFRTLLTSDRVLARLTCNCSCLIAARAVLSASFILRSTWRCRSGGTRSCACCRARLPALTARPTMPDRLDVRFLFAMHNLHKPARGALNAPR